MHGPGFPAYPALYRGYVYYLSTQLNREQFMQNPLAYLKQPSPKPVVPIRMAIIGPPESGKTTCKYSAFPSPLALFYTGDLMAAMTWQLLRMIFSKNKPTLTPRMDLTYIYRWLLSGYSKDSCGSTTLLLNNKPDN